MKRTQIIGVFLLSLTVSCSQPTQSVQKAQTDNQSPASAGTPVTKSERGTPAEAKAMLRQAIDHYNSAGRQQALADFTAKKPPFGDRDLYVACIGADHTIIANGGFPSYVGLSVDGWKDVNGNSVGRAAWDAAKRGEESISYQWINPVTHKMEPKVFFVQKVGDDVCGVGAYNPK